MRLLHSLILLFTIASTNLYAQDEGPRYTWESLGLKGSIRSITTVTYQIRFDLDKNVKENELYAYRTVFYKTGFIDSTFSRYNSSNKDFNFDYHYYWRKDTFVSTIHKVNAFAKALFNKDRLPVYTYFYYEKAVTPTIEGWNIYDNDKKLVINKGIQDGRITQTNINYKKNTDGTYTVTSSSKLFNGYYQINKSLKMVKKVSIRNGGAEKEITKYEYDSFGNIILEESTSYIKDKQVGKIYKTVYKYNYDFQNNWTEKKIFKEGGLYQIEKRLIEYW